MKQIEQPAACALAEPDHIPDAGKMVAEPCEMGAMCLNCQPRGPNGECPDAPPPPTTPSPD